MNWRSYIYFPRQVEYAVPLLIGLVASVIMATTPFSSTPTTWPPGGRTWEEYSLYATFLLLLNGLLLWGHIRGYYLTWKTALAPLFTSLITISTLYTFAYGITLFVRGRVSISPSIASIDTSLTLYCLVGALSAMFPFMAFPAIWKPSSDSLEYLRESRVHILEILRKLDRVSVIKEQDKRVFIESVRSISNTEPKIISLLHSLRDKRKIIEWKTEFSQLENDLEEVASPKAYTDYLRQDDKYNDIINILKI